MSTSRGLGNLFEKDNKDVFRNLLEVSDYPTILMLCGINKESRNLCQGIYSGLIEEKRMDYLNMRVAFESSLADLTGDSYPSESDTVATIAAFISFVINDEVVLVDHMIKHFGINPGADDNDAIIWAAKMGNLDTLNRLLEDPRVNPGDKDNVAIIYASRDGHLAIVNRLLEDPRVDPADSDNEALGSAAFSGNLDIVNRLLEDPRVNPADMNNRAMNTASLHGQIKVMDRLLKDPRVFNSLSAERRNKYMRMIRAANKPEVIKGKDFPNLLYSDI